MSAGCHIGPAARPHHESADGKAQRRHQQRDQEARALLHDVGAEHQHLRTRQQQQRGPSAGPQTSQTLRRVCQLSLALARERPSNTFSLECSRMDLAKCRQHTASGSEGGHLPLCLHVYFLANFLVFTYIYLYNFHCVSMYTYCKHIIITYTYLATQCSVLSFSRAI